MATCPQPDFLESRKETPMAKEFYGIDLGAIEQPAKRKHRFRDKPKIPTTRMALWAARMTVRRLEKKLAREAAAMARGSSGGRGGFRKQILATGGASTVLVSRMTPGAWYARCDVQALMPEYGRLDMVPLIERGWLDRVDNPDREIRKGVRLFRGTTAGKGWYLYRLSKRGEAKREALTGTPRTL